MKLLPYDAFTIQTPDSLAIVLEKLAAHIEPSKTFRWSFSRDHAPYEGRISDTGFEIHRIIHYRNSFLPIIRGRFDPLPNGTAIHITMGLHPVIIGFLGFWCLTWYSILIPVWLSGSMPNDVALIFLGCPTLGLFIFWCAFWYEANRSRRELIGIIQEEAVLGQRVRSFNSRRSNSRKLNTLQVGLLILGIGSLLWQLAVIKFFPSAPPPEAALETLSCSKMPSLSPYCNFSVVHTLVGHSTVTAIALSADGQTLVSGGRDKAIKVWDLNTGQLKQTLQSDSGIITTLAIAPDGQTIVSGSGDRMVRVWNLGANQPPLVLAGHPTGVSLVQITPDGKTIISASHDDVNVWDLATGQLKATLPTLPAFEVKLGPVTISDEPDRFIPLTISPDGKTAIFEFLNGKVVLWDLATDQQKAVLNERFDTFSGYILSAQISPDGTLAAAQYSNSSRKFETQLKVWDLATATVKARGSTFFSRDLFVDVPIALSRDRIIGSTNGKLKIWNLQTAELEAVLDSAWMSPIVVSPDGKRLAGVMGDPSTQNTEIRVLQRA